jgi:hypothetical protein
VLAEIARQQPPADVVIVADRMPDDQPDLLALIELRCRLRRRGKS